MNDQNNTKQNQASTDEGFRSEWRNAIQALTASIPDLEILSLEDETLLLTLSSASRHLPDVFAAVAEAGGSVTETSLRSPNLETLFLLLTGKELRQ